MTPKYIIYCSIFIMIMGFSCQRYEEGPFISIWPAKDRIINTWKWSLAIENEENQTGARADSTIQFRDDEVVRICDLNENCREGTWNLVTNKKKLQLIFGRSARAYTILKLKKNEMWLYYANKDSTETTEWELVSVD